MTPTEIKKLKVIAEKAQKLERKTMAKLDDIIDDAPSKIITFPIVTWFTRQGAKLGKGTSGASLKTSSMASTESKKFLNNFGVDKAEFMIKEALFKDPELFKAIVKEVKTKKDLGGVVKKFNSWTSTLPPALLTSDPEE